MRTYTEMVKMLHLINRFHSLYSVMPVYHYICTDYLPESLFFLEDQVNQGDQEDPKSKRKKDKARKRGML